MIDYQDFIYKLNMLGIDYKKTKNIVKKANGEVAYFFPYDSNLNILLIPDDFNTFNNLCKHNPWSISISRNNNVKVIGGANLTETPGMFQFKDADSLIDLTDFGMRSVTNASHMFQFCECEEICFPKDFPLHIKNMFCMFNECHVKRLDLSMLKANAFTETDGMFYNAKIEEALILSPSLAKKYTLSKLLRHLFDFSKEQLRKVLGKNLRNPDFEKIRELTGVRIEIKK